MKRFSNFIYHNSDILVTLLILAAVSSVILWRVDLIMHYSVLRSPEEAEHPVIDIDFSGIDLAPEEEPGAENEEGEEEEPPAYELRFDELFRSPAAVNVTLVYADTYQSAVRRTAEAYGFSGEDYLKFYNLLWNTGVEIGVDEAKISAGKYTIPAGSSAEEILRIITGKKAE